MPETRLRTQIRRVLFPRKTDWPRISGSRHFAAWAAIAVAASLTATGFMTAPETVPRAECGQWPWSNIWRDAGECVGASSGSYTFGREFQDVMGSIAELNQRHSCAGSGQPAPVTVGALVTLGSLNSGVRAVHELEGFAAALEQSQQQGTHAYISACPYQIHLEVAQMGSSEQAALQDAQILVRLHAIAVVGMGLSSQQSATAAQYLNQHQIPMVADVISAEGFDQDGSASDHPNFSSCSQPGAGSAEPTAYEHGLGQEFFRVAFRNYAQIQAIINYLASIHPAGKRFVVEPDDTTDPYDCTTLPLIIGSLSNLQPSKTAAQLDFDAGSSGTGQGEPASIVCEQTAPVTVFYAARAVELATFLSDLIKLRNQENCDDQPITVLSLSDAAQLRVQAPTQGLENIRDQVLGSGYIDGNWLRLLYTPLADPDLLTANPPPGYAGLLTGMRQNGFAKQDLADGWAIMAYDALAAVATALGSPQMASGQLQAVLESGLHIAGADGTFWFNGQDDGNRSGVSPVVVRLCRPGDQAMTVAVHPGKIAAC